jgi:predicted nucleic acid-binding Zn ribbon protein
MKICEWCSNDFDPNVSYQIYCSPECRSLATKEKVNKRYQSKKRQKLSQKQRRCSNNCGTILSMYNSDGVCSSCLINVKQVDKALKELKGIIEYERFE